MAGDLAGNAFSIVSDGKSGSNPVLGPASHPVLPAAHLIFADAEPPTAGQADQDAALLPWSAHPGLSEDFNWA